MISKSGWVWSRLITTLVVAELPALSTAVPVTVWFAPSVDTVDGAGQYAIPLASEHVKVTITSELFHPAAFGVGETEAVIVGGIVSCSSQPSTRRGRCEAVPWIDVKSS